ncbi:hypothetical protein Q9R08_15755 [Microbacterium sp. QXD-8]|uniref:DUF2127 domain-containing protein n=1 Tax=Microbacterium psychrotolerans TaxID=3068321 RepID=A0ABU0Z4D1_9MICO|nr:hypothetical protein [Microbacterium sp. QXD-8]MDQ7879447.1 hypothetical protein [Microbacterium sp. QXD-8]
MTEATHRSRARRLRIGGALLLAQGVLMEATVFVGVVVLLVLRVPQATISDRIDIFALAYLNENLYMMMAMSGIFAALRIIGAIGVLRNRLWALVLTLINCTATLLLMVFMLPAGLVDGLLTGTALVLILSAWIPPNRTIIGSGSDATAFMTADKPARTFAPAE